MPSSGSHNYQSAKEITITTTGNIDALDPEGASLIRMDNASLATVRGIVAGYNGQEVTFVSVGAGQVDFSHQNANPSAANRLINIVSSIVTSLAGGLTTANYATFKYDGTTSRWRLVSHEQGKPVSYTTTWGNSGTANTLGDGTLTASYTLRGNKVFFAIVLTWGSTTASGSGFWSFTVPASIASAENNAYSVNGLATDTGVQNYDLNGLVSSNSVVPTRPSTTAVITAAVPFAWGNTDILRIGGIYGIT